MVNIPPRLQYYYELKPGKYLRFFQNNEGGCYLTVEETERAAFLRKGADGEKVWKWLSTDGHEGFISDLMHHAQCYPYSYELHEYLQQLSRPSKDLDAYAFLHPGESVDGINETVIRTDWARNKETSTMLDQMSDDYWDNHYDIYDRGDPLED